MEETKIVLQELITAFTNMIIEIRQNSINYKKLQSLIEEINTINPYALNRNYTAHEKYEKGQSALALFEVYKTIIKISMEIRKILPQFEVEVAQYNNIDYALYFKNQVYYTKQLKPEWLSATKSGLVLRLSPAIKELTKNLKNDYQLSILNAFNQHYNLFLNTIEDSYQRHHNGRSILKNQDRTFNKGHVAEAHERHLQEHHNILYQAAKDKNIEPNNRIQQHLDNMIIQNQQEVFHETASTIWKQHMLASFGFQRGTVAGDVNSTQVKQGQSGSSLRLTKIGNLRTAIKTYSDLFNPDIPAKTVATKIALYMSDITDKDIRTFVNKDFFNEVLKKEPDFNKVFKELEKHLDIVVKI